MEISYRVFHKLSFKKNRNLKENQIKQNSDPDIAQLIDGLSRTRDKSLPASRIDRRTRVGQTHRFIKAPTEIIPLSYNHVSGSACAQRN